MCQPSQLERKPQLCTWYRYSERGKRAPPALTSLDYFSIMMEFTPESGCCHCALCELNDRCQWPMHDIRSYYFPWLSPCWLVNNNLSRLQSFHSLVPVPPTWYIHVIWVGLCIASSNNSTMILFLIDPIVFHWWNLPISLHYCHTHDCPHFRPTIDTIDQQMIGLLILFTDRIVRTWLALLILFTDRMSWTWLALLILLTDRLSRTWLTLLILFTDRMSRTWLALLILFMDRMSRTWLALLILFTDRMSRTWLALSRTWLASLSFSRIACHRHDWSCLSSPLLAIVEPNDPQLY